MLFISIIASIFFSIASFAWGFFQAGYETTTKGILIFGFFWFISIWRKWRWFPSLAMLLALILGVLGIWNTPSVFWMFSGAIFTLIVWDLNQFKIKLTVLPEREDKQGMTKRRLIRIGVLTLLGLGMAAVIQFIANR